jgi:hypothetical protein
MDSYYEKKFNDNKSSMHSAIFEGLKKSSVYKADPVKEKKAIHKKVNDLTHCYETILALINKTITQRPIKILTEAKKLIEKSIVIIKKFPITNPKYNVVMLHELDDMFKTMLKFDKTISWALNIKSCLDKSCNYSCGYDFEFYDLDKDDYKHELDGNNGYFLYEIINDDDEEHCYDDLEEGLMMASRLNNMTLDKGQVCI